MVQTGAAWRCCRRTRICIIPIVENFVDAVMANDVARLACPAEQGCWVDWVIEQVVRPGESPL